MMSFVQRRLGLDSDVFEDEEERQVADKQIKEMLGEEHSKRARLHKVMGMTSREYQNSKWICKPEATPKESQSDSEN